MLSYQGMPNWIEILKASNLINKRVQMTVPCDINWHPSESQDFVIIDLMVNICSNDKNN